MKNDQQASLTAQFPGCLLEMSIGVPIAFDPDDKPAEPSISVKYQAFVDEIFENFTGAGVLRHRQEQCAVRSNLVLIYNDMTLT
jgi:hypothetical protein